MEICNVIHKNHQETTSAVRLWVKYFLLSFSIAVKLADSWKILLWRNVFKSEIPCAHSCFTLNKCEALESNPLGGLHGNAINGEEELLRFISGEKLRRQKQMNHREKWQSRFPGSEVEKGLACSLVLCLDFSFINMSKSESLCPWERLQTVIWF